MKDHIWVDSERPTTAEIRLVKDPRCEMAGVYVDDHLVMLGNYWDFHPYCHGGELHHLLGSAFHWESGCQSLIASLRLYLDALGVKSNVTTKTSRWEGETFV